MRLTFRQTHLYRFVNMVGVRGFEPRASWSRTKRATNCATPRQPVYYTFFRSECQDAFCSAGTLFSGVGMHYLTKTRKKFDPPIGLAKKAHIRYNDI